MSFGSRFLVAGVLLILCFILPKASLANELSCKELISAINMVRANSIGELNEYRLTAGKSYRSDVIYSFKYFEIVKNDANAVSGIFKVLPGNDQQYVVWMTMGDSFCQSEKTSDMRVMGRFGERLPLLLSRGVVARPREMPRYIEFSLNAAQDSHGNLLLGMRHVCHVRHEAFKKAVDALPLSDRNWFINHVMQVDNCRPLIFPESD